MHATLRICHCWPAAALPAAHYQWHQQSQVASAEPSGGSERKGQPYCAKRLSQQIHTTPRERKNIGAPHILLAHAVIPHTLPPDTTANTSNSRDAHMHKACTAALLAHHLGNQSSSQRNVRCPANFAKVSTGAPGMQCTVPTQPATLVCAGPT